MTLMQERAFEMIKRLSDDKIYYIVQLLEGLEGLMSETVEGEKTLEQKAYENLQQFRRCNTSDIDYKEELKMAREEKYAGIN